MVFPDARRIAGASNIGNVLELVEHFDELGAILAQIFSGLLGGVERLEVGICPADLLADDEAWRAGTGIDVEFDDPDRDVPTDLIEALAKLRDRDRKSTRLNSSH